MQTYARRATVKNITVGKVTVFVFTDNNNAACLLNREEALHAMACMLFDADSPPFVTPLDNELKKLQRIVTSMRRRNGEEGLDGSGDEARAYEAALTYLTVITEKQPW